MLTQNKYNWARVDLWYHFVFNKIFIRLVSANCVHKIECTCIFIILLGVFYKKAIAFYQLDNIHIIKIYNHKFFLVDLSSNYLIFIIIFI